MRYLKLLLLPAAAAVLAASTAFAIDDQSTATNESPASTQVQAAQTGEVSEAVLVEDTTPRPMLVGGAPDGDAAFVPMVAVPAPPPAPEPEPAPQAASSVWSGVASWYGAQFAGQSTASGETFDPAALTAAHRTLPFGTQVRVTLEATGQSVIVRINDRGPFSGGREIDLSRAAADAIGLTSRGTGRVTLEVV